MTGGGEEIFHRLSHYLVYLTLENHDMFSYEWGKDKVVANQLQAGKTKAAWIRNFDCFREGTYYSRVYEIGNTTYNLLVNKLYI